MGLGAIITIYQREASAPPLIFSKTEAISTLSIKGGGITLFRGYCRQRGPKES